MAMNANNLIGDDTDTIYNENSSDTRKIKPMTEQEAADLKYSAENELNFNVNFEIHQTMTKGYYLIHILPRKKNGVRVWSRQQVESVWEFMQRHNLTNPAYRFNIIEQRSFYFGNGVKYLHTYAQS